MDNPLLDAVSFKSSRRTLPGKGRLTVIGLGSIVAKKKVYQQPSPFDVATLSNRP
jgi:hypothetical protein